MARNGTAGRNNHFVPHPVEELFSQMTTAFQAYPPGMTAVPIEEGLVQRTSFFPGGYGLWKSAGEELPPWPEGRVMVVGNDWGDLASFTAARNRGSEATGSTWRGLLDLLPKGLEPLTLRDCFFTNAFMGLRVPVRPDGSNARTSAVGECPGRRDPAFKERCWRFLEQQILAQKPHLILSLGRFVPDMLSRISGDLSCWRNDGNPHWDEIDASSPLKADVRLNGLPKSPITVCALTRPDRAWLNYPHRTYGTHLDELGLLRAAIKAAGFA